MEWSHLDVRGEMGNKNGLPCAICGTLVEDLIFFPTDPYSEEVRQIISAWRMGLTKNEDQDPAQFFVCHECMCRLK